MVADPAKCQLCDMCELVCSLMQENAFNPHHACIKASPVIRPDGELDASIEFDSRCDGCGICVRYCVYGALSRARTGEEARP